VLLQEPPRSQGDLHFRIFDIPVRVHPLFWFITLALGLSMARDAKGRDGVIMLLMWIGVVFVSVLIHELGHALMARKFGWPPTITLHSFGGLASYRPTYDDPKKQILISLAGPGAGFLFVAIIIGALAVAKRIQFGLGGPLGFYWAIGIQNFNANVLLDFLIFVNLYWGLINLLPVYPLDGGQIAREALTIRSPREGMIRALWLSVITGGILAFLGIAVWNELLLAIMFGYFAYQNYKILQQYKGSGGYGGYGGYDGERDRW
jgi:stage IV sporulation protein FB